MLSLVFCALLFALFLASSLDLSRPQWQLLLPGGVLAVFLVFAASRKTVQLDERCLYVSTFRKVTAIPLEDIQSVSETIGLKDRFVTVQFRHDTPVGRSICFTPTVQFDYDPHPIVSELQAHAKNS